MKTLAKQGFLLLVLLVAISNSYSLERPDFVKTLVTSSNADEDKEMIEEADTPNVMRYLLIFSGVLKLIQWTGCIIEKILKTV